MSASHSNSKYETRSTKQIQNWSSGLPTLRAGPQFRIFKCSKCNFSKRLAWGFGHLDFGNSNLFRISIFEFRIYTKYVSPWLVKAYIELCHRQYAELKE